MKFKLLILSFFLTIVSRSESTAQTTGGFYIENGSTIPFVLNSFQKLTDGVTYTDWTRIKVKMEETSADAIDTLALGWTLSFRALTPNIEGSSTSIPLSTIRMSSTDNSPNPPQLNDVALTELTTAFQTLASATPGVHVPNTYTGAEETILDITYECGANNAGCATNVLPCNRLLGYPPDLYVVDIQLLITVP